MNGSIRYWIAAMLIGVAASVGGYYLAQVAPLLVEYAVSVGIVLFFVLMSLFYTRRVRGKICKLYDKRQQICRLGIREIYRKAEDTIVLCLNDVRQDETYKWLGFTGVNVVCTRDGERAIVNNAMGNRRYEFCTLDPQAQRALVAQASWEARDLDLVTNNLRTASVAMDRFRGMGLNVLNWTHFSPPTFRLVILGERRIHIGFYYPGQSGIDTPEIELVDTGTDECIFKWFQWFYTKTVEDAKRYRMDRMILKAKFENPAAEPDVISQTFRAQGIEVTQEEVQCVLEEYEMA